MTEALDFQSIIFNLQTYWAAHGCLIAQPYYSQVGAGTMNPATFLRVLGPEPWKVAYVEPSVRPDDGRYGINPNRLQQHHQFQVILKPDPGNPQELYLNSLLALGIDPRQHDIRFVEDNWESPALSAWGLGWEVWLDGQEITQFTYFQQSGGVVLDVPSVEMTYGLERIAMTLQRVRDFKQISWNENRSYGDIYQVAEREHSTYYYEVADVPRLREMFNLFASEAENALGRGLVLPAYDNIIKCSHTFNILDARGAVGFTERQALFGRMRQLSRQVSEAYLAQRKEMGFPWRNVEQAALPADKPPLPLIAAGRANLLFEIGTEELPTADLDQAIAQLDKAIKVLFVEARLGFDEISVKGTPRRLAVMVSNLVTTRGGRTMELKGPPADRAFDADGKPTKVAEGFARSRNVTVEDLKVKEFENGRYVVLEVTEEGRPTAEILSEMLPLMISNVRFTKSMRWNDSGVSFSRPIRWLVALLGDKVIPFSYAGLQSGRTTFGLRHSAAPQKSLANLDDYRHYLAEEGILLDQEQRRSAIWQQALALARKTGGILAEDPALLEEVTNLVERPTALLGTFDQRYLQNLPPEVLIGVMKKHQRYFPVLDSEGKLTQHFIVVRNGDDQNVDIVADGNLQVIHARFADAEFFIKDDLGKTMEDFVANLGQLTFQKQLGSMLDKTHRIEKLTTVLAGAVDLNTSEQAAALRVAHLCKADLASSMVIEMTSLQGVMGRYYARRASETEEVAQGIFEHYLPRTADDSLPAGNAGTLVGIADRLDSLAGLFAVGLAPTGNKDPFALRRTALGLVQILIAKNIDFDLSNALAEAARLQPVPCGEDIQNAILEFITGRVHGLLLERGMRYDVVDAVEQAQANNPARAAEYAVILNDFVTRPEWQDILPAYSRSVRITRDLGKQYQVRAETLAETEEQALYGSLLAAEERIGASENLQIALNEVEALVSPINNFFDRLLVMADDLEIRANRLGLLQRVAGLIKPFADLSKLEGF